MVLDMDTTDIPMLTTARGLLMPNPRLMLTLIFSMVDTMDLDTMAWLWISLWWLRLLRISNQPKRKKFLLQKRKNSHPNLLLKLKSVSVLELISLVAGKIENLTNKSKCHYKLCFYSVIIIRYF